MVILFIRIDLLFLLWINIAIFILTFWKLQKVDQNFGMTFEVEVKK